MATDPEQTALAPATGTNVDAYEARFMAGEGTVLFRARTRAHWSLPALILGAGGIAALGSSGVLAAAASFAAMALMWLVLAVLRVTVSERSVNVQLGVFGPKIPMAAIQEAHAIRYHFTQFGGWGIRFKRGGVMYNLPGDGGHALRIVWWNNGKRSITWVGTRQAEELAEAIGQARAALPAAAVTGASPAALDKAPTENR